MSAAVHARRVSKTYTRGQQTVAVLRELDLEIQAGEFVALMGPSGSGKTTLLNLIAGLDSPVAGELSVAGVRIDQLSGGELARWRARHIGFVFQFYNLLPTLTAEQNVEVPLLLARLSRERRRKQVSAALQLVGLAERSQHKPNELSGGQQQRVSIARAIVPDPSILVCDEPTGDLDRESAEEVLELLRTLNQRHGKTIVMVTHDPKAAEYATRQLHVDKGLLVARVSVDEAPDVDIIPELEQSDGLAYDRVMRVDITNLQSPRSAANSVLLTRSEPQTEEEKKAQALAEVKAWVQAKAEAQEKARARERVRAQTQAKVHAEMMRLVGERQPPVPDTHADFQPAEPVIEENDWQPPGATLWRSDFQRVLLIAGATAFAALLCGSTWYLARRTDALAPVGGVPVEGKTALLDARPGLSAQYLDLAKLAFQSGVYVTPGGASAVDLYRKVLADDPDNIAARDGIRAVADALLVLAERAALEGRFDAAEEALAQVRTVDAKHPHLDFVTKQIALDRQRIEAGAGSDTTPHAAKDAAVVKKRRHKPSARAGQPVSERTRVTNNSVARK